MKRLILKFLEWIILWCAEDDLSGRSWGEDMVQLIRLANNPGLEARIQQAKKNQDEALKKLEEGLDAKIPILKSYGQLLDYMTAQNIYLHKLKFRNGKVNTEELLLKPPTQTKRP